jgi:thiamine-monophosphate kinase
VKPEDRFVEKLRAILPRADRVRLGPGDDAAVLDPPGGALAATTDLLVEGVDFLTDEDPERLGRRAAAVNLSDLAAVGATPEFFLLSIAFPVARGEAFALAVARGAVARAGEFGAHLAGGDLSASPTTVVSIALWGSLAAAPLRRAGAAPGDRVYVSGSLGEAAAGLRLARAPAAPSGLSAADRQRLLDAFRDPVPRVALGLALSTERLATAAIDVSDGLGADAGRLARSSGVRLALERDRLPISAALAAFAAAEGIDAVELALSGGDDYELLFTVPRDADERLQARAAALGIAVTRIGHVEPGAGAALLGPQGERDVEDLGHDHLEAAS